MKRTTPTPPSRNPLDTGLDTGAVLPLFAVLVVGALTFILAMTAVSFIAMMKARHQNVANLAALAALQGYMESDGVTNSDRIEDSLASANQILASNPVTGAHIAEDQMLTLGNSSPDSSEAKLLLGNYYPELIGTSNPCTGGATPPCFVPIDTADPDNAPTAAKVILSSAREDDLVLPFGPVFGQKNFDLEARATASLVQRCMVLLLDASTSVSGETHRELLRFGHNPSGTPSYVQADVPQNPAYLAYRASVIGIPPRDCHDPSNFINVNHEYVSWCLLDDTRPSGTPVAASKRFKSDYSLRTLNTGDQVYVDTFGPSPPEPFTSFYQSFNVTLRLLRKHANPIDMASLLVFGSGEKDFVPLQRNYGPLIQLTNMDLRGLTGYCPSGQACIPERPTTGVAPALTPLVEPNFVSRGHLSLVNDPSGKTNLVFAFTKAIEELRACPSTARKSIIIATDGKATCARDHRQPSGYLCGFGKPPATLSDTQLILDPLNTDIGGLFSSENAAITAGWPFRDPQTGNARNILEELLASKIAVTTIMSGEYLGLNFRNVQTPQGFLDFASAAAQGWHGRNRYWFMNHAPHYPNPGYHYFFNPEGTYPSPTPPGMGYWEDWRELCATEHRKYASSYGDPFSGTPPYYWWCDYNTYHQVYSGVLPGTTFRVPAATMGEISMRTGGVFCPLMPRCHELPGKNPNPDHWYRCPTQENADGTCPVTRVIKNSVRDPSSEWGTPDTIGEWQNCSVEDLTTRQQAEKCGLLSVGSNPYMLVAE